MREILIYGRPGTPMPAWGADGGGPLTTQQIDELIAYLGSIQLTSEEAQAEVEDGAARGARPRRGRADRLHATRPSARRSSTSASTTGVAGGAYSCARCHTKGASIVDGAERARRTPTSASSPASRDGSGAFGFSLTSGVVPAAVPHRRRTSSSSSHEGTEYGTCSTASGARAAGRMPGFGDNPNTRPTTTSRRHVHRARCSRPSPSTRPTCTSTAGRRPARRQHGRPSPTPTPPRPRRPSPPPTTTEEP